MITFDYSKREGGSGNYTVLVVDPNRQNSHANEPQLHGFVIDELSDSELIEFFSSFRKGIRLDYEDRRASVIEELNTDEAYTAFKSSKYVKNRTYRTFNLSGMKTIKQILIGMIEEE